MYYDYTVEIPKIRGKIVTNKVKNTTYVCYEFDRVYNAEKKYNTPNRTTIGKVSEKDPDRMYPNLNYLKFFPDAEIPEERESGRSSCLKIGAYLAIRKIIKDCKLEEHLSEYFSERDLGLLLDLAVYSIITEDNAGQYYPDYTYNHPLLTQGMKMYSDATVSYFLNNGITADKRLGFLEGWNAVRNHRERIYVSHDSTNKNCQAGDVEIAELGHAKDDPGKPIINYSVAYDCNNREPLFYEDYCGSINDVSQLKQMIGKAQAYGYRNIGFILDRGYFSQSNIHHMDKCGYHFVIMMKGMKELVNELVLSVKGSFEERRDCAVKEFHVYGMTVKKQLYPSDEKERYFHIYYDSAKVHKEREDLEDRLDKMSKNMAKHYGEKNVTVGSGIRKYYEVVEHKDGTFLGIDEIDEVIEKELKLSGYFVIITSEKMTAADALRLYKGRDASEKLFRGDKSYLGNKSYRNHHTESVDAKIFVEFIALIVRSRMHVLLSDENKRQDSKKNYLNVPAAIRQLEKLEMIRLPSNVYRQDHAITATQKTILGAFDMTSSYMKNAIRELSETLTGMEA